MIKTFFTCKYKKRIPDPGICKVIRINFEDRNLEISNGYVRLYPSFDEVIIYDINDNIVDFN